jgi:hypothetical protein
MHASDAPTLRLVTLRRLVAQRPSPLIVDVAEAGTIVHELSVGCARVAVLVDADGAFCGTLCPGDAQPIVDAPVLLAEADRNEARSAMVTHGCDRVIVATATGELLGVLVAADLGM